jgi:hypothetical protein
MNIKVFCEQNKIDEQELDDIIQDSKTILQFAQNLRNKNIKIEYNSAETLYYKDYK